MTRKWVLVISSVAIAIFLVAAPWSTPTHEHMIPIESVGGGHPSDADADATNRTGNPVAVQEELLTHLLDNPISVPSREHESRNSTRDQDLVEEHPKIRATHIDLVRLFLLTPEAVTVADLESHSLLNPRGNQLDESQRSRLRVIVSAYGPRLLPLMQNYRRAVREEMESRVRDGRVRPAPLTPPSDQQLDSIVRTLKKVRGSSMAGKSDDEILANVRSQSPVMNAPEGWIKIDGSVYRFSSFASLPISDEMFESIAYFGREYLATVCYWFESEGLAFPNDVESLIARAIHFTAVEGRGVR